ncbi:MAG: efflux RND transporter periplasmic adaptor subunit [Acidobacteriota bacterium]
MKWFKHDFNVSKGYQIAVIAFVCFLIGYWISIAPDTGNSPEKTVRTADSQAQSRYVCPMMCLPPMDHPGHCPVCGMELVEVSGGRDNEGDSSTVSLDDRQTALAGIRTAPVEKRVPKAEISLYGKLEYDPYRVRDVTVFAPCIIQRVYVQRAGAEVMPNTPLFDVYSPELYFTEVELIEAAKHVPGFKAAQLSTQYISGLSKEVLKAEKSSGDLRGIEEVIEKLSALRRKIGVMNITYKEIDAVLSYGVPTGTVTVYALRQGRVIKQNAVEGTYVNAGTPLVSIVEEQYIWANLDAYESDYLWLKYQQPVKLQADAYPGETFNGSVAYIEPTFDSVKRTFKVGVLFQDPQRKLKAQMSVRAVIEAELSSNDLTTAESKEGVAMRKAAVDRKDAPLVIPASAPLITGKRAVVYVQVPDKKGVYEGREIVLGPRAKDCYIVREGLKEGELVVVNGAFKLDSAVQILAGSSMMQPKEGRGAVSTPPPPSSPSCEAHPTQEGMGGHGGRQAQPSAVRQQGHGMMNPEDATVDGQPLEDSAASEEESVEDAAVGGEVMEKPVMKNVEPVAGGAANVGGKVPTEVENRRSGEYRLSPGVPAGVQTDAHEDE